MYSKLEALAGTCDDVDGQRADLSIGDDESVLSGGTTGLESVLKAVFDIMAGAF